MSSSKGDRLDFSSPDGDSPSEMQLSNGMTALSTSEPPNERSTLLSSSLSMAGLLKGLRRRWLLASSLGLVCAAACAVAAWYLLPPAKYTAQVLLRVDSVPQTLVFHDIVQGQANFQIFQKNQIALVKRRLVLNAALRKCDEENLGLIHEHDQRGVDGAMDWLERELLVDFTIGPEILRIALSGDRPEELRKIVTAIENAYLKEIVQKDRLARASDLDQMTKLAQQFEDKVRTKRDWLAKISKPLGTNDSVALATIRRLNEEYLKRTEMELLDVRADLRKLESEASGWQADSPNVPANPLRSTVAVPDHTIDEYLRNDLQGKEILARKLKIEAQIRDAQTLLSGADNNPIMKKYKKDLEAAELELAALRKDVQPRLIKQFMEKDNLDRQANQARLQQRVALLKKYESWLQKDVNQLQKKIEDIGKSTVDIESDKADLAQAEETAKKVARQVEALKIEQNAPERISHLEDAYVTHPDELKRKMIAAAIAGGSALGLILLAIGWWEFRRQRVNSVDEVVTGLGMKLMGTVPALPRGRRLRLAGANGLRDVRWQNILTESVDTARTVLLHMARSESLKVVMVTSAMGGEGKTSLSSHLAASLARAGRRTLLLDADLRNPAIHRLFGVSRSPGLCELLRGENDLASTVQPTPAPQLTFIPAGRCDSLALQALAQDSFQSICAQLRTEYDFIVIDSAPVLPVADSLLVAHHVDAVIFSILHDVSHLPKVYAAHQRLEMLGIRMLGAVVSGTQVDTYSPDYQYAGQIEAAEEDTL
jgi:polysaccharide biosynthesis transport protein